MIHKRCHIHKVGHNIKQQKNQLLQRKSYTYEINHKTQLTRRFCLKRLEKPRFPGNQT